MLCRTSALSLQLSPSLTYHMHVLRIEILCFFAHPSTSSHLPSSDLWQLQLYVLISVPCQIQIQYYDPALKNPLYSPTRPMSHCCPSEEEIQVLSKEIELVWMSPGNSNHTEYFPPFSPIPIPSVGIQLFPLAISHPVSASPYVLRRRKHLCTEWWGREGCRSQERGKSFAGDRFSFADERGFQTAWGEFH